MGDNTLNGKPEKLAREWERSPKEPSAGACCFVVVTTRQDSQAYQFSEGVSVTSVSGMRKAGTEQTQSALTVERVPQRFMGMAAAQTECAWGNELGYFGHLPLRGGYSKTIQPLLIFMAIVV